MAPEHAVALAETGRWLVRVLAEDPSAAAAHIEALIPLATVGKPNGERLPFTT